MKFRLKKSMRVLLAGSILLAMVLGVFPINKASVSRAASEVAVNLSSQHQEIMGYGGMNHPTWIGDLTSSQRETAFGNGDNQLGLQILRIWVDSDSNNWYKEVATAKAAIAKGAIVFATPWNPPSNLCETFYKNGVASRRLKHDKYYDYAMHLNNFVTYMKNNGVNLYAISCANEPDYGHDWTWWTESELFNFVRYYAQHINCRVIAPESFSYKKSFSDALLNDSKALANVEIIGTHLYGTQYKDFSYPLFQQKGAGKQLWMTEVYYPNSNANSADLWPEALGVSEHIHNAMVNNMQTYVWWYIRRSYSPMKENGAISKRGYCMAQYSKFIRRGYKRVSATENPATGVYVSAYTGDGKAVIVAINKGSSSTSQYFRLNGKKITSVDRYRTSSSENLAKTAKLPLSENGFWANLTPNSVSTFVCTLDNSSSSSSSSASSSVTAAGLTNGWYHIKNTNAGKYLQVANNTGANETNVEISTGNGSSAQKWYLENVGNGYVTLKNGLGYMLDVQYGKNEDGANIQTYSANGADAQKFKVANTSKSGVYGITTKVSSDARGLDVYNFGKSDGTNVCQWDYNATSNQTWTFEPCSQPYTGTVNDGWYYIKNPNSNKYLQVENNSTARGANVEIGTGTGVTGQRWYVTNSSDGYVTLKNGNGYMLDIYYGKNEDGTNIRTYTANGDDAQKFKIMKTSKSGVYGITTKISSDKRALDIYNWGTSDGTNVCQWSYYAADNQMWIFEPCN